MANENVTAKSKTWFECSDGEIKQIKLQLQKLLFEDNLRKQEYVMRMRNNLHNPKNLNAYKSALRWRRNQIQPGERSSNLTISLAGMSTLFRCSLTTANRIKQKFRDFGWYEFFKQFSVVAHNISQTGFEKGIKPYFNGSVFYRNGKVYRSEASMVYRLQG